jgi:hypothetical protein
LLTVEQIRDFDTVLWFLQEHHVSCFLFENIPSNRNWHIDSKAHEEILYRNNITIVFFKNDFKLSQTFQKTVQKHPYITFTQNQLLLTFATFILWFAYTCVLCWRECSYLNHLCVSVSPFDISFVSLWPLYSAVSSQSFHFSCD